MYTGSTVAFIGKLPTGVRTLPPASTVNPVYKPEGKRPWRVKQASTQCTKYIVCTFCINYTLYTVCTRYTLHSVHTAQCTKYTECTLLSTQCTQNSKSSCPHPHTTSVYYEIIASSPCIMSQ